MKARTFSRARALEAFGRLLGEQVDAAVGVGVRGLVENSRRASSTCRGFCAVAESR
jgi:hypothetical protein